jgi:hypothetical protein
MKSTRLKLAPKTKSDLFFPPPFQEQGKYLELADKFLSRDGEPQESANVLFIASRHFRKSKTKKAA